jgi:hypothetical protein
VKPRRCDGRRYSSTQDLTNSRRCSPTAMVLLEENHHSKLRIAGITHVEFPTSLPLVCPRRVEPAHG